MNHPEWHNFIQRYTLRQFNQGDERAAACLDPTVRALRAFLREALVNGEEWFNENYSEFLALRLELMLSRRREYV